MEAVRSRFGILLGVTIIIAGCGSPTEVRRAADAAIQTDELSYTLERVDRGFKTEIGLTFANTTGTTVFIVNCGGDPAFRLEKLVGNQWVAAWSPTRFGCLSEPIVLGPGEQTRHVLAVFGGDPDCGCNPRFATEALTGVYRVVLDNVLDSFDESARPFGDEIDVLDRVSNRFMLTR